MTPEEREALYHAQEEAQAEQRNEEHFWEPEDDGALDESQACITKKGEGNESRKF